MAEIKISEFTIDKIKNRAFEESLPELYQLEEIIENSLWHINESVFDHTIAVVKELEELIEKVNVKLKDYLNEKINNYLRKEVLLLGAIFHDIGKVETFIKEDGTTKCLGHEEKGAEKLKEIIRRFDLLREEQSLVIQIVKNHGVIHDILSYPKEQIRKEIEDFKLQHSNIFWELVLLSMADLLGSQLKQNEPEGFKFRKEFLNEVINNY